MFDLKKLLNTLYVTTENAYLSLDGENVIVSADDRQLGRVPLHTLDGIITFGYVGASPALMGKVADMNKQLVFLKPSGRFLAKITGKAYGNILLRREQYRFCDDSRGFDAAKSMISAKISNSAAVINRTMRDHSERIDTNKFEKAFRTQQNGKVMAYNSQTPDELRGIEGECAQRYFDVFDDMILQQKEDFFFKVRSRRPPMDRTNAMLSFSYSILTSMCVSALETVGLDPYAGFFHTDRPGRCSLALDLVEEFRAPFADRFVLTMINKKILKENDFITKENGSILLTDDGRKTFLSQWQLKKHEIIMHPVIGEKVEWGLLPYLQAMLLAKYVRQDIDCYPPFLWK